MSLNVEKCIDVMKQNEDLVIDLNAALTAIFVKASVQLTLVEKLEFWDTIKDTIDSGDPNVHVHWT